MAMNPSRFYMWRAVVAMVHADGVVTPHEVSFVNEQFKGLDFTQKQLEQLAEDFKIPQDVNSMFAYVTTEEDKRDFFALARALSWCDGDMHKQEKHIIDVLEAENMDADTRGLLEESKEVLQEVDMSDQDWTYKNEHGKSVFGFLKQLMSA